MTKQLFAVAASLVFAAASTAYACDGCGCKGTPEDTHAAAHAAGEAHDHDIVDTAVQAGGFDTLVAAVKAADLVEVLKGEGPFTVFAPTDEAFAALPEGTVASLLEPSAKDKLTAILLYHVVPGKVMAADVVGLSEATTANEKTLSISTAVGAVTVAGATVVKTDIECTNGVIHVIDAVMLP